MTYSGNYSATRHHVNGARTTTFILIKNSKKERNVCETHTSYSIRFVHILVVGQCGLDELFFKVPRTCMY